MENQKTFKFHCARILGLPESNIETYWREARERGIIKTGARGVHGHVPTDMERRRFLRFIAMKLLGHQKGVPVIHNSPDGYRDLGVRVERVTGIRCVVEIPSAHVCSILDFGTQVVARAG